MAASKSPAKTSVLERKLDAVLAEVISQAKPTEKERSVMTSYSNEIMSRLKKAVPKNIEIVFVGSVARGTQVRGSSDIDIFLLFPKGTKKGDLEKKGLEYAKKIVRKDKNEGFVVKFAEHPYLKIYFNDLGIKADIVPAYKIDDASQMGSAVDRTQLHNKFILASLTAKQKDQVIALKVLLKSHSIYGAEAKTEGFSGYLCELLIYNYGSFAGLVKRFSDLKLPILITPRSKTEIADNKKELGEATKKFGKSFIVVDPTDDNRNVAAATSGEALARFVLLCRRLLREPSTKTFLAPKYSDTYPERRITALRESMGLNVYALSFNVPDISEDIIWQQLRRLKHNLMVAMQKNGFPPVITVENTEKSEAVIALFTDSSTRNYSFTRGPSAFMGNAVDEFLKSHKGAIGIMFEDERILSIEPAKYKTPDELLRHILKDNELFPSYLSGKTAKLYANKFPENTARLIYSAFMTQTSI